MILLTVDELAFEVEGKKILDRLVLALAEGEIHALLGANGTGKTTLANLIMGCAAYTPSAGKIHFQGRLINPLPLHERALLGITMTWQEPARFEGLLVKDYLALKQDIDSDPAECLRRVGLQPDLYLERAVDKTLSGGERKRIELASVLALQPRLAILDEPASGIDMLSIQEIVDVIQALQASGSAVLLITHRQEIARVADRASYLCGGRIVATGEPNAIAEQFRARRCVECDGEMCHD
ncbi:MAG: ATP-binding cassette domain-containing protein [Candidatus Sedimenticola sp. (ex Thyasira tokunagai)]